MPRISTMDEPGSGGREGIAWFWNGRLLSLHVSFLSFRYSAAEKTKKRGSQPAGMAAFSREIGAWAVSCDDATRRCVPPQMQVVTGVPLHSRGLRSKAGPQS